MPPDECAESGLLDPPTAAAIGRVKGVPVRRVRSGTWLTATRPRSCCLPPLDTLIGLRDRAILGLLIELANLTFAHLYRFS
ncbi:MAG: hypothetical protein JOZ65_00815 [Chloroflexi bacterium]|nr:hypothetical protein [Chloroflexota bacterium]